MQAPLHRNDWLRFIEFRVGEIVEPRDRRRMQTSLLGQGALFARFCTSGIELQAFRIICGFVRSALLPRLLCPGRRSIRWRGFDDETREISYEPSPLGRSRRGRECPLYSILSADPGISSARIRNFPGCVRLGSPRRSTTAWLAAPGASPPARPRGAAGRSGSCRPANGQRPRLAHAARRTGARPGARPRAAGPRLRDGPDGARAGGCGVPDPDRTVAGTGHQSRAVRAEGQREDVVRVSLQPGDLLAGRQVPQPDGPVAAGRRQPLAVRMEYRREHLVGVPGQDGDAFRRGHIPDADGAITAGGGQQAPIAAEGDGVNQARMTRQPGRSTVAFACPRCQSACRLHPCPPGVVRPDCRPATSWRRPAAIRKEWTSAPVAASMIVALPSASAAAMRAPSGLTAIA